MKKRSVRNCWAERASNHPLIIRLCRVMSLLNISLKEMCVSPCAWAGVEVYATEHRLWTMQTIQSLGLSYGPHHRTVSVSPTNEQKTMRNQIKSVHLKYVIWRSTLCSGNMEELFRETKSLEQHFIGNFFSVVLSVCSLSPCIYFFKYILFNCVFHYLLSMHTHIHHLCIILLHDFQHSESTHSHFFAPHIFQV